MHLKHGTPVLALTLAMGTILGASGTWLLLSKNFKQRRSASAPIVAPTSGDVATAAGNSSSSTSDSAIRAADRKAFNAEKERLQHTDPKRLKQIQTGLLLRAQMSLGRFGYGTQFTGIPDEETTKAIREYQHVNKLPVTGEVDFDTLEQLDTDDKAIDQKSVYLPESHVWTDSWDQGYFRAKGSWVEEGDKRPSENSSEIICLKENKICVEAKAERSPVGDSCLVNLFIRDIARWDGSDIVTVPEETPCARETMEVSRRPKSVLAISRAAYKDQKYCQELFGESRAMVFHLEGGQKINDFRSSTTAEAYRRIMRISQDLMRAAGISSSK